MSNNLFRRTGFGVLLLPFLYAAFTFAVVLFVHADPAPAQVQTFDYLSPPFTLSACGSTSPPCLAGGNITGSFTFKGVTPGFSGTLSQTDAVAWTTNGAGVGSLNQSNFTTGIIVYVTNGQATDGGFGTVTSSPPTYPYVGDQRNGQWGRLCTY